MGIKHLVTVLLEPFKYAATGTILFLLTTSPNSFGYIQAAHEIKERTNLNRKEPQARMFLITVIDSNDDSIGKRCEKDLDEVNFAFEDIADWLDVKMEEPKIIKGDQFSKAAVNKAIDSWLQSQKLTTADIVIFYYSGHGFRFAGDASDYPRMWLKTAKDKNPETTNLRMEEDIYDHIMKMGAGVNIILSDCCNTTDAGDDGDFDEVAVPTHQRITHKRQKSGDSDSNSDVDNADKLFIPNHPLSILATAAAKGEFAGGKADTGGFFTNYLLEALTECIYEAKLEPTWDAIFKYADENAGYWARSAECPQAKHNEQGRCVQTARFIVNASD